MNLQPPEDISAQLSDDTDWLNRAIAVRNLKAHGKAALPWLSRVFELTFDPQAPIQDVSCALIKGLDSAAVPFLLERLNSETPAHRQRAIELLMECGWRLCTTTMLVEQVLGERDPVLPDWGRDPETVIGLFHQRLSDPDIRVRFASASALEEFGRYLPETVHVFVEILVHGTDHEQNWAALRLGRIGKPAVDACNALRAAADSDHGYTRLAAKNAISSIGGG